MSGLLHWLATLPCDVEDVLRHPFCGRQESRAKQAVSCLLLGHTICFADMHRQQKDLEAPRPKI